MNHDLTLTVSDIINAPVSSVWKALTDKEIVKKYFFGTELDTEWKVGKPIYFRGNWEGNTYEDKGTVLEYEEGKKLTYNYWSTMSGTEDIPENYAKITYAVEPNGQGTTLHIIQKGSKDEEAHEHSKESWAYIINELKKIVE
ncbi:MAG: SRPBCC domain-containing protein [Cyclobacteriaceae bacterium]|nr:SRPBCC domain-containing protein [Cyclobacteriaceae bacterium]